MTDTSPEEIPAGPDPQLVFDVAETIWDRREAEYWDSEQDRQPFDPEELIDGEPDAADWLAVVREILAVAEDLRAAS